MTTGHPSKAALGAARIALLAGVSAAAIFAASTANAQTTPPVYNSGGSYSPDIDGSTTGGTPRGADLSNVTIPGLGIITTPQVLENVAGTAVIPTTAHALNADGTPKVATYGAEVTAAPGTYVVGSSTNNTNVLVNSATGELITVVTAPAGLDLTGATPPPAGYAWAAQVNQDRFTNTALYSWVPATYANDPAFKAARGIHKLVPARGRAAANENTNTAATVLPTLPRFRRRPDQGPPSKPPSWHQSRCVIICELNNARLHGCTRVPGTTPDPRSKHPLITPIKV